MTSLGSRCSSGEDRPPAPLRLKSRRGGVLVFVAASLTMVFIMLAFVVELARFMSLTSELQVAADAAALAGADGLSRTHDGTYVDTANTIAPFNNVEGRAATMVYTPGQWAGGTFTPTAVGVADAVRAAATQTGSRFFWGLLGASSSTFSLSRSGTAWAGGSARSSTCIKPWAIGYAALLSTIGFNAATDTGHVLTETDVNNLIAAGPTHPITLNGNTGDVTQGAKTFPGNFGAVDFPPVNRGSPVSGASTYEDNIKQHCGADTVAVGDALQSEPGRMVGPTEKGVEALCGQQVNGNKSFTCTPPVPVEIALYASTLGGGGKTLQYIVKYVGAFLITGFVKGGTVTGYFTGLNGGQGFTALPGPVHKIVLVK